MSEASAPAASRWDRLVAKYREDHRHPVNHVLHVGVGWPIMALAVVLVPFRPWWSLGLFCLSYGIMWTGHFAFERNLPTVFRHPTTPFVMAWAVICQMARGVRDALAGPPAR
ncbi:hypothetical protein OJF2_27450 [Aquisphaera giovannonii]|uniref:DUF962 domain-containing protein n=1 Tax=Aquisphaera giovannonii TaxID=406548 RepID=A0A5B9W2P0_9BACT|nr:DUF962 domain-containing protein [Aquisphaera giovannonii]QEH34210.1 hypothetical protein OJF2_27450 [Aquisphaera giovannonii]